MDNTLLLLATITALASLWMAIYLAPRWALKARIHSRLRNRDGIDKDEGIDSWLANLAEWFVSLSAV
ncbi:MAG: hypothetical protein R3280_12405, partial [Marinobacter sp.]|uniref:hypothetical protein n=1 Tax=Marinobacter sp. TaxID=50741 RepID=UPI00299D38C0